MLTQANALIRGCHGERWWNKNITDTVNLQYLQFTVLCNTVLLKKMYLYYLFIIIKYLFVWNSLTGMNYYYFRLELIRYS